MATFHVGSFKELKKLAGQHAKDRHRRVKKALHTAAEETAAYVRANIPRAFGDLSDATRARGESVVTIAPHAGAVESGSRPHWMPLEPLIRWVKLRGMQGLKTEKQIRRLKGKTTAGHARSIAQQIRDRMSADGSDTIPVDAPEQIARAIQVAIAKGGTKPHWYMRGALPTSIENVSKEIEAALPDK